MTRLTLARRIPPLGIDWAGTVSPAKGGSLAPALKLRVKWIKPHEGYALSSRFLSSCQMRYNRVTRPAA